MPEEYPSQQRTVTVEIASAPRPYRSFNRYRDELSRRRGDDGGVHSPIVRGEPALFILPALRFHPLFLYFS